MKYNSIVLDLDGTVLNSKRTVSAESVQALRECITNGLNIWITTARSARTVYGEKGPLYGLDFLEEKGVFYNGAYAFNKTSGYTRHYRVLSQTCLTLLRDLNKVSK